MCVDVIRPHLELKRKNQSRAWAKFEFIAVLTGFAGGLLIGQSPDVIGVFSTVPVVPSGGALSVPGGNLALAGHRSHLYQSDARPAANVIHRVLHDTVTEPSHSKTSHATDRSDIAGSHHR